MDNRQQFFIMSTEFDKNISDWSYDCTDHKNSINKAHEKNIAIFVISAIMASIWNVFIKFRWHDEKLTAVHNSNKCHKIYLLTSVLFCQGTFISFWTFLLHSSTGLISRVCSYLFFNMIFYYLQIMIKTFNPPNNYGKEARSIKMGSLH